jgi:hypothetical protein
MEVYRAPMRSRAKAVDGGCAVERALTIGVCGVGGVLSPAPSTLAEAVRSAAKAYDERLARRLERFAHVAEGAFVWTRDAEGGYHVGRLTGPWRYDPSAEAAAADLVHVRDCTWRLDPIDQPSVPAAVVQTFGRGGRNFQRIHAAGVGEASAAVWD